MRSLMGLLRHHHYTFYTALVLLLLATSASATTAVFSTTHQLGKLANPSNSMSSNSELSMSDDVVVHEREEGRRNEMMELVMGRRRLGRLGSAPPSCRSKCGRCSPCKPVHVPIQPGRSMTLEYYPEAWRCKCGNKLFMP